MIDLKNYSALEGQPFAFVDSYTISNLVKYWSIFLLKPVGEWESTKPLRDLSEQIHAGGKKIKFVFNEWNYLPVALQFAEQLFLFDALIIDHASFSSLNLEEKEIEVLEKFKECFFFTQIPKNTYVSIAASMEGYQSTFRQHNLTSILDERNLNRELIGITSISDKDKLLAKYSSWLRNSNNEVYRSIFYHELASCNNMALVLCENKTESLNKLGITLEEDALQIVTSVIKDAYENKVKEFFKESAKHLQLNAPPLIKQVIDHALKTNSSLLESILFIKATPKANSFRKFLHDIYMAKDSPMELQKHINELSQMASSWATDGNTKSGVFYENKTLSLEKIPGLSQMLEFFSDTGITIKDPILFPRPYLSFISSWYGGFK